MHNVLADSLISLREAVPELHEFAGIKAEALSAGLERLRTERVLPEVFAQYYDLVPALEADLVDVAGVALRAIIEATPFSGALTVCGLEDPELEGNADLYRRKLDTDPATAFQFLQPSPDELRRGIDAVLRVVERFEPVLVAGFGELRATISRIVLATGAPGSPYQFGGGSSYMLWGALMLNAQRLGSDIDLVLALMHETAHTQLFGNAIEEPLVGNADEELFSSPLRLDPRPMDGIYHATFVTARMVHAATTLLSSSALTDAERDETAEQVRTLRQSFASGLAVIREHGRLTEIGTTLMESAAAYMKQFADA